ncbi:hypothetical protein P7C73_g3989, partial [Tremellales sp. Uapishka_1]
MALIPSGALRDAAITIGPFKPSRPGYGPVLSYLQAAQLETPLRIHPLLNLRTWDPKPYGKYLAWNTIEHPMFAAIWVDYDVGLDMDEQLIEQLDHRVGMDQRKRAACHLSDSGGDQLGSCGDGLVGESTESDGYNMVSMLDQNSNLLLLRLGNC